MAYRYGDRKQRIFFPQSIDEYIPEDAPVRTYDVFVDSLNLTELGVEIEPHRVKFLSFESAKEHNTRYDTQFTRTVSYLMLS